MTKRVMMLAGAFVVLALAGCASGGSAPTVKSTTIAAPTYPQAKSYTGVLQQDDLTYRTEDGAAIKLNACEPKKKSTTPRAAIVIVHGGSWRRGDKNDAAWRSLCPWLASAGFVAFSIDYRLAPEYPFPDGLNDLKASVRWIRAHASKYDIDPTRVGAFGGSAGGNLVSMLGTDGTGDLTTGSRVAAVAELSGPADLSKAGAELSSFLPLQLSYLHCRSYADCPAAQAASPLYHVDPSDPPFFVAHSIDERIPLSQSENFVRALRGAGIHTTFVTVRGTLHSVAMLSPKLRTMIVHFFDTNLG
jgi:acetyl esterase/lipase